jgi:hypothetical protein
MAEPSRPPSEWLSSPLLCERSTIHLGFRKDITLFFSSMLREALWGSPLSGCSFLILIGFSAVQVLVPLIELPRKNDSTIALARSGRYHNAPRHYITCRFSGLPSIVPVIRHTEILFHRIKGYIILLLSLISTIGAFMRVRHTFGGILAAQTPLGFTSVTFLLSLSMAYYNMKRL